MLDANLMTADLAIAQNAQKLPSGMNVEKLEKAAQEFEAVFISEMMKPMFAGIKTDGTFGGGKGEEVFRSMLVQEYGKNIAQTRSLGIADHIKAAMIQMQEQAQARPYHNSTFNNGAKTNETPTP